MSELLLSKLTKKQFENYLQEPSSVMLLAGQKGGGKKFLALKAAENILDGQSDRMQSLGRLFILNSGVGIDEVRAIIKQLAIKATSARVVIINEAEQLGHEAQNALLKTLEEAPSSTYFILTSSSPSRLLTTIRSRATTINVKPIDLAQTRQNFANKKPEDIQRSWLLSEGLVGDLQKLMNQENADLKASTDAAKTFLGLGRYERAIYLDSYTSRDNLLALLDGLKRVLKAASNIAATNSNEELLRRLTLSRRKIIDLIDMASANASPKLINLYLATTLKV